MGKRCKIEGKDIGKGLIALVNRMAKGKAKNSMAEFLGKLGRWEEKEIGRAERSKDRSAESRIERIRDQADTLRALSDGLSGVPELKARIDDLFANKEQDRVETRVTCSSIHRSKGLEADRVFVLRDTLNPSLPCGCGHWPGAHEGDDGSCHMCHCSRFEDDNVRIQEERNIEYVAITRAKEELIWVDG
jgi:superfamily I DNA/RNA helicase